MDWFFIFKRLVGMVAQPLPVVFLLLTLGLILLALAKRRRIALACIAFSLVVLYSTTFPPLVRFTAGFLENQYPPLLRLEELSAQPVAIVILGNGVNHPGDPALPALSRLNDCARARLVEGVRLWRLAPEARLITSGYGMGLEGCAQAMAEAAVELGVPPEKIEQMAESMDTEHEAELAAGLVGDGLAVLVTSAVHMPRAVGCFQARGVNIVPAPCDFVAASDSAIRGTVNKYRWRPKGQSLAASEAIWHEALGLLYQRLFRGR